jgi:hypothetical protein
MSGSAGLAAAKRRRAAPSAPTNEIQRKIPSPVQEIKSPQPVSPNITNSHPLLILSHHDQQIQSLQREIEGYRQNKPPSQSMDEQTIQYFKRQYESVSEEVQEMKKLLIKIQTFSMETNLELLKMKRLLKNDPRLKENDENPISQMENLTMNE